MKSTVKNFDYIVEEAQSSHGMTIQQTAQWHYWNKNGVMAAKKASDARISKAVAEGKLTSGHILTVGSMDDYYSERLMEVVRGKKTSKIQLRIIVDGVLNSIKKANDALTAGGAE